MSDTRTIARDLLACATSWEPGVRLLGNVTAREVATLCRDRITERGRVTDELARFVDEVRQSRGDDFKGGLALVAETIGHISHGEGQRRCGYCLCITNANFRQCCERGTTADRERFAAEVRP